ncbi:protein of unknown function [Methylocella tundrae]|uniref:Uncharacterized protein n=1 Tax=Methylocella tundrae TaxID=227605 RepID=A0A4U8YWQ8_METTU|nr:protein of unknown function [Methylocella tundrae]
MKALKNLTKTGARGRFAPLWSGAPLTHMSQFRVERGRPPGAGAREPKRIEVV